MGSIYNGAEPSNQNNYLGEKKEVFGPANHCLTQHYVEEKRCRAGRGEVSEC